METGAWDGCDGRVLRQLVTGHHFSDGREGLDGLAAWLSLPPPNARQLVAETRTEANMPPVYDLNRWLHWALADLAAAERRGRRGDRQTS